MSVGGPFGLERLEQGSSGVATAQVERRLIASAPEGELLTRRDAECVA
jgi:hypothetical protein